METSPAVEARVRDLAEKLERFSDRISGCHIVIERPHLSRHQREEDPAAAETSVRCEDVDGLPDPDTLKDIYAEIRDAFATAARQLEGHTRRMRGSIKTHPAKKTRKLPKVSERHPTR